MLFALFVLALVPATVLAGATSTSMTMLIVIPRRSKCMAIMELGPIDHPSNGLGGLSSIIKRNSSSLYWTLLD